MSTVRLAASIALALLLTACGSPQRAPAAASAGAAAPRPLVVQGAMDVEVRRLVGMLDHPSEEHVQGWTFWSGTLGGAPVVISKTLKGTANAAAATALAIERYHPMAIINQGTAGGHDPALHVGDIVLGTSAINIGSFKTGSRARGAGSDVAEWQPMDLNRSDGSAGQDPNAWVVRRFPGDAGLLAAAAAMKAEYTSGRVVEGVIGSSDMWNSELDRIQHFHDAFGTSAEEMETAAAAQVAALSQTPFLGIRVLSNNITNGDPYDGETAAACQMFVAQVVRVYLAQPRAR